MGHEPGAIWTAYATHAATAIRWQQHLGAWGAALPGASEAALEHLRQSRKAYARLDRSVLLAMLAGERAAAMAGWAGEPQPVGLQIGSSRGATGLWEQYYGQYTAGEPLPPQVSPLTTAGNLATHTAQHLGLTGLVSDSSITCSTALHAVANAVVWLESGRYDRFLAGGAEAPLTPFTVAQMKALKIYASDEAAAYPNRALEADKTANTMVLGEGSALFALATNAPQPLALIKGMGYAREATPTLTAVSAQGDGIRQAMAQAWQEAGQPPVDVVICHSPGTVRGDASERNAIRQVFGENIPSLASNKWKLGHTLGASGGLSLELALLLLQHQTWVPVPYLPPAEAPQKISNVLVNALGFGGNAVSLLVGL